MVQCQQRYNRYMFCHNLNLYINWETFGIDPTLLTREINVFNFLLLKLQFNIIKTFFFYLILNTHFLTLWSYKLIYVAALNELFFIIIYFLLYYF